MAYFCLSSGAEWICQGKYLGLQGIDPIICFHCLRKRDPALRNCMLSLRAAAHPCFQTDRNLDEPTERIILGLFWLCDGVELRRWCCSAADVGIISYELFCFCMLFAFNISFLWLFFCKLKFVWFIFMLFHF